MPFHAKLLASYLLVLGLVFVPALLYVRTTLHQEITEATRAELDVQVQALVGRFNALGAQELRQVALLLADAMPRRLTVLDASGHVLADSSGAVDSHFDRPEVQDALSKGTGSAIRRSHTTGDELLYVARRFPATGPASGVVRMSTPVRSLTEARSRGTWFLNRSAALSLSAAVLLTLLGYVMVTRPLRRLSAAARAFAGGDFGHELSPPSDDELGELARALGELAEHIRGRLLASGADRSALQALLDDLPAGVVVYDPQGAPLMVGAQARLTLGLSPTDEVDKVRALAQLPSQRSVIERVLDTGVTEETALEPPWPPRRTFKARWVALHAPDGRRQPALVVVDTVELEAQLARTREALAAAAERLRETARAATDAATSRRALETAEQIDASLPAVLPRPAAVRAISAATLLREAIEEVGPLTGATVELELEEPEALVVEADGRARRAVRQLLKAAASDGRSVVRLRGEVHEAQLRLTVRMEAETVDAAAVAASVQCLGGEAGNARQGHALESWLALPLA